MQPSATPVLSCRRFLKIRCQSQELAFEGHRLFDLTRNKISFTKIRRGGTTIAVTYPHNKTILPIPQRELDANPNIRGQQNADY